MTRYDRTQMGALQHPIDDEIRERLRKLAQPQAAFARQIGRSQGWLSKYMRGDGNATIDDIVRMLALLIGVETEPLSDLERGVLKALRAVPEERREDAALVMMTAAKGYRRGPHPKSAAPAPHTPPAKAHTARGTRRDAAGQANSLKRSG